MDHVTTAERPRRETALGTFVDLLTRPQLNELIFDAVQAHRKIVVANHNLHSLALQRDSAGMRRFYELADYVHIDGTSLLLLGKLLKWDVRPEHRIAYLDWYTDLLEMAVQRGWGVFWIGSEPAVLDLGLRRLRQRYPRLSITGHHGYFDMRAGAAANEEVLARLTQSAAQIVFVGMGMPRQEIWVQSNLERIPANVVLTCGGLLDFIAGAHKTPPRFLGRVGLEWLFRLLSEPRRLWSRYLVEPLTLLAPLSREIARVRWSNER